MRGPFHHSLSDPYLIYLSSTLRIIASSNRRVYTCISTGELSVWYNSRVCFLCSWNLTAKITMHQMKTYKYVNTFGFYTFSMCWFIFWYRFLTHIRYGNNAHITWIFIHFRFGRSTHDEMSILTPVIQCCLIRLSTILKLISYYNGPVHLSDLMRTSLKKDSLPMLLNDAHLTALDRRVAIILREISHCLNDGNNALDVVVDDKF